jgi:hypothetical protein
MADAPRHLCPKSRTLSTPGLLLPPVMPCTKYTTPKVATPPTSDPNTASMPIRATGRPVLACKIYHRHQSDSHRPTHKPRGNALRLQQHRLVACGDTCGSAAEAIFNTAPLQQSFAAGFAKKWVFSCISP